MTPTPTQSDEAMKECPFCGGKCAMLSNDGKNLLFGFGISCGSCSASIRSQHYDTPQKVITAWNTRTKSAALAAERRKVERLENKVELAREGLNLIMMAYERRVRSACQSYAELANRPWRCYEYTKAENALAALQDEQQGEM